MAKLLKPGFCCLGIVDTCMLRCGMCQKWKADVLTQGKTEATTEQYKTFLKDLATIVEPGFEIDFGGGEALMRPDVLELVRFARDLGFRTTIASNGWLIDERMAERIAQSGLTSLILSLDSLEPEVHDMMRGVPGVQVQVMRAITRVRQAAPSIHIGLCSIIMERTLDDIIPLADWSHAHHDLVNSHLFMAVMQPNNTGKSDTWFRDEFPHIWPHDTNKVHAVIDELIRRRTLGHWIGNSVEQLEAFKLYFERPGHFVKRTPCNLDRAVHVAAVGDVYLCFRWGKLGNIQDPAFTIARAWYAPEAERVREDIRQCSDNCHYLLNCFFEGDVWENN